MDKALKMYRQNALTENIFGRWVHTAGAAKTEHSPEHVDVGHEVLASQQPVEQGVDGHADY